MKAQAEALRAAARTFVTEVGDVWGGDSQWLTTGNRVAEVVACVLREMAADIDRSLAQRCPTCVIAEGYDRLSGPCPDCQGTGMDPRYRPADSEGVGTGAGEGATGQDTGTAWVTRSTDCPEAPAQAHPLGAPCTHTMTPEIDLTVMDPWGPFEMGGFEGCTDVDPERCACATDQQPTCEICAQEIEPGEQAWSRQWPCYNTLPLNDPDMDWDVISWHDECPSEHISRPGERA